MNNNSTRFVNKNLVQDNTKTLRIFLLPSVVYKLKHTCPIGSGPRYMICVTHFCTLSKSKNQWPCENRVPTAMRESRVILTWPSLYVF